MNIKEYEKLIITELDKVIENIIDNNRSISIAVRRGERVGDGISKFLENKFVEHTKKHKYFKGSISSPEGKTKNPFDVQTVFELCKKQELIWIDFKAINIENEDTNPDSGTPDKVIDLMQKGFFYLIYVIVCYKGTENGLEFVKYNKKYVKSYFLKDVNPSMRITPANQMQVNGFAEPAYRTREEFLDFLIQKKIESNQRKYEKAAKELKNLKQGIWKKDLTIVQLKAMNKRQEDSIKNL